MTVTIMYDQLKEKRLENIAWVKGVYKDSAIFKVFNKKSKPKAKFTRIYPFKKEKFVKENYEFEKEAPEVNYDRVSQQKFVVYKRYHFYQKDIFGAGKKKFDHLLELHFNNGTKRAIKIRQELYRDERFLPEEKFFPTFFGKGTKPDPRFSPKPVLPKEARNDANEKYEEFVERQNEAFESRNEEAYRKTIEEIENTYGTESVPDFDGLYRE